MIEYPRNGIELAAEALVSEHGVEDVRAVGDVSVPFAVVQHLRAVLRYLYTRTGRS